MLCLRFRSLPKAEWTQEAAHSGCVYFIRDRDHDRVKVGYSMTPERRLRQLQTGSSGKLEIVALFAASPTAEQIFHRDLAGFAVRGEWFASAGAMRWIEVRAAGLLLSRCKVELIDRAPVQVWWEWDPKAKGHNKHVWDTERSEWVRVDFVGAANARPGWSATSLEISDE